MPLMFLTGWGKVYTYAGVFHGADVVFSNF